MDAVVYAVRVGLLVELFPFADGYGGVVNRVCQKYETGAFAAVFAGNDTYSFVNFRVSAVGSAQQGYGICGVPCSDVFVGSSHIFEDDHGVQPLF